MDIFFTFLFLALLAGMCYAYLRYPAFRTAVGRSWDELLKHLNGDAQRQRARTANEKANATKAPSAQLSARASGQGRTESKTGNGKPTYDKILDKIVVLKTENDAQKQYINSLQQSVDGLQQSFNGLQHRITDLQQRLDVCERQMCQQSAPTPPTSSSALIPGRTYYAIQPSSKNPYGFRNEDWSAVRPNHSVYTLTVKVNGEEAEFSIDPMGMPEVLNALAYYKDIVSYCPVDPNPQTYVPVPGLLRYANGIWQVITPIRLEGRA